ncbi:Heterogeneous nuclear ribonucleoprotein A3, partial [Galemys pyrenaicus]
HSAATARGGWGVRNHDPNKPEQLRKLFTGDPGFEAADDGLREHLQTPGGSGCVNCRCVEEVEAAMCALPHMADGPAVGTKAAVSRQKSIKPGLI